MIIVSKAYQAENLVGSRCTAPLRAYNTWFQNKIQASDNECERIAWKISSIVTGIFAYLTLGILALVGIAINLFFIPPENGYSLWAKLNGIPAVTEEFCEKIQKDLSLACQRGTTETLVFVNSSSSSPYTYNSNQQISFDIQNVFEDIPLTLTQAGSRVIEVENEDLQVRRQGRMQLHITQIQNTIRTLSQKRGWCPEKIVTNTVEGKTTVAIPLPDQI